MTAEGQNRATLVYMFRLAHSAECISDEKVVDGGAYTNPVLLRRKESHLPHVRRHVPSRSVYSNPKYQNLIQRQPSPVWVEKQLTPSAWLERQLKHCVFRESTSRTFPVDMLRRMPCVTG